MTMAVPVVSLVFPDSRCVCGKSEFLDQEMVDNTTDSFKLEVKITKL